MPERVTTPRNSRIRNLTKDYMMAIAAGVYNIAPWLTPNEITLGGFIGVAGVATYAAVLNRTTKVEDTKFQRTIAGVIYTALCLSDGLDGALERYLQSIDSSRKSTVTGALLDVTSDRMQELALALSRAASAYQRGDRLGEVLAYGAALTNPLSSGVRAGGEGYADRVFAENGNNWAEFFGTRLGRAIIGGVATQAPEFYGIQVQNIADVVLIASNLASSVGRMEVILGNGPRAGLSNQERAEARQRFAVMGGVELVAGASVFTMSQSLRAV